MNQTTQKPLTLLHIYGGAMKIGGHYRSGLAMCKGLIERGHKVIVLAPDAAPEMAEAFRQTGAVLELSSFVGKTGRLPTVSGWKAVARIAEQQNIDIIHSMDFINAARGYRAAVQLNRAFFCTEAGCNWISHFPPRKARVVLFSGEQMEIYRNVYRLSPQNLKIIRARIDADFYYPKPAEPAFIERFGLSNEGLAIGIVTRLQAIKEHKIRALIAFAKHYSSSAQKVNIYVVGDGDCRAQLQKEAEAIHNPSATIRFLGPMYDIQDVNQFYNFCDIVIGSGRGIMEAMACKKAVIIPGWQGQAELIGPENIDKIAYYNFSGRHFAAEPNTTDLADVLKSVCEDPDRLTRCAAFSYEYARQHLIAAVGVEQLVNWYQKKAEKSSLHDFVMWYIEASYWLIKASWRHNIRKLKACSLKVE